jgi:Uma2 family endonuclease
MLPRTTAPWAEPVRFTADGLMALPDDGWQYELVQGRLVRMPPTGWEHGTVAGGLYAAVYNFVTAHGLGSVVPPETGFDLTQPDDEGQTVIAPHLAFVSTERLPSPQSEDFKKYPHLAPDLVVEVASPTQSHPAMADKARVWLVAGVRLVWVVWPSLRQVDVWLPGSDAPGATLGEADVLDGRDVLPGFTHPVAQLFRAQ